MSTPYNLYNFEAEFKKYLIAENFSSVSSKNYLSDLRHFLGWLSSSSSSIGIELDLEQAKELINKEHLLNYKTYLIDNELPLKTVNRRLSTLRKFCSFCISQGWLNNNPAKEISNLINKGYEKTQSTIISQYKLSLMKTGLCKKEIESNLDIVGQILSC